MNSMGFVNHVTDFRMKHRVPFEGQTPADDGIEVKLALVFKRVRFWRSDKCAPETDPASTYTGAQRRSLQRVNHDIEA